MHVYLVVSRATWIGVARVLLGPVSSQPELPGVGTLTEANWDAIVLRVSEAQLENFPEIFRQLPMDKVRRRQRLDMKAFASIYEKRCF